MTKLIATLSAILLGITAEISASPSVQIDGSSTMSPLFKVVADGFQQTQRDKVKITIAISGDVPAFRKLCRAEIDVIGVSRPIPKWHIEACKRAGVQYLETPVAYDVLAVVVHPGNDWVNYLAVGELKKIWEPAAQNKIHSWNQVRRHWPEEPLTLFGPATDSGTFDFFTEVINNKTKSSRSDFSASAQDNVLIQATADDRGALGYLRYGSYFEHQKRIKAIPIDSGRGPVFPSAMTIQDGTYQPFSRPMFVYVSKLSLAKLSVKEFIKFYLTQAPHFAKQVKYQPLPNSVYSANLERLEKGKFGTAFDGAPGNRITIDDLLSRKPKI